MINIITISKEATITSTWKNPEIVDLGIEMTEYGRNYNAKEANANKNPNNGAGGSLNNPAPPINNTIPGQGNDTVTPGDMLS